MGLLITGCLLNAANCMAGDVQICLPSGLPRGEASGEVSKLKISNRLSKNLQKFTEYGVLTSCDRQISLTVNTMQCK